MIVSEALATYLRLTYGEYAPGMIKFFETPPIRPYVSPMITEGPIEEHRHWWFWFFVNTDLEEKMGWRRG